MAVPILMYHQITPPPGWRTPYRSMSVHPSRFLSQMQWLKRLGIRGVSLREALPYISGEKTGKVAAITFDDGFQNVFTTAMPILKQFGFNATCFFVSNQIGGSNVWDKTIGVPSSPCMSTGQAQAWAQAGFEVGSHTLDHVWLGKQSGADAIAQLKQSKTRLEALTQTDVSAFCYPYGDENPFLRQQVAAAGYQVATTTRRGRARASDDIFGLPRVTVRRNDTWLHFVKKCISG